MLQLALKRLLLELVLVHKVRQLGLGRVSVLPQILLNALLLDLVSLMLADQGAVSLLHLGQFHLALL